MRFAVAESGSLILTDEEEKILEEDVLIARGPPVGIDEVKKLAKGTSKELD